MQESIYAEYVNKFLPRVILSIIEKINGKRENQLTYLHQTLLRRTFSADGRWSSVLADYSRVAADVVALDAELPLKSLDRLETASGDIPKLGFKFALNEKEMMDIDKMIGLGLPVSQIVARIFTFVNRVIVGIYERIEDMFLCGLSTGVALSTRNVGTGLRLSYGYLPENQLLTEADWNDADTNIIDELQKNIFDKALEDQNTITDVYLDDVALRKLYKNKQIREQFAFNMNFVGQNIPNLDLQQINTVFQNKWGVQVHRVARSFKTEVNGVKDNHKAWAQGRMVFVCNQILGDLVWTNTVESQRPVAGVTYQTADQFILVSQYSKNDPIREFTSSQAMVIPVIDNVDQIYTVDTETIGG